ncbi:MAG: hypothetical protein IGS23_01535 [Rivularia sp. T60_A2020_040]|nr:hypothetical protein [Rivularia sp. T60_A2020_040]
MKETIKLMADYGCYPLWWVNSEKIGDIDPETLPLSQQTINRLEKWAEMYDAKLDENEPALSIFSSNEEQQIFEEEGINLWKQLKQELATNYEVVYFSEKLGKTLANPNQLKVLH